MCFKCSVWKSPWDSPKGRASTFLTMVKHSLKCRVRLKKYPKSDSVQRRTTKVSQGRRAGCRFGSSSEFAEAGPKKSLFQLCLSPIQYVGKVSPEQRAQESNKESWSMSESYFQMVRGMWLSVLCITEMSRMMCFNVCKIMMVCAQRVFFLIWLVLLMFKELKMVVLQLDSEIAKPDFQPWPAWEKHPRKS